MAVVDLFKCSACDYEVDVKRGEEVPPCAFALSGDRPNRETGSLQALTQELLGEQASSTDNNQKPHEMKRSWQIAGAFVKW